MSVTKHDQQLVEPMMRELMDIQFEIDGRTGDNVDHLRAVTSNFLDRFNDVLEKSFFYVADNAEEEAENRGADNPEHVEQALLASVPMTLSGTLIAMVLEQLLLKGLSGVAALQEGRVSNETASKLIDEMLKDTVGAARNKALKVAAKASGKRQAQTEVEEALARAANQSKQ